VISNSIIDDTALVEALRALPASGEGSFENLVRDLLSRETGRRFTVAKSGPQGGIDGRTSADRHATAIGVETKRYGAETRLPLDETKSKLRDAASEHPDLDVWILAASREIMEPDRGKLLSEGDRLGIQVLLFDWPESNELLPALRLLAAAHPDVLAPYGLLTQEVRFVLDATCHHPGYTAQLSEFSVSLAEPHLGYGAARVAAAERLRRNMSSMVAAATRIGRYANLTDPKVLRINRPEVQRAIGDWWASAETHPVLTLLGPEGVGKTWAALSWWLDRELSENALPLTLVIPAKRVAIATADAVVGQALHEMFGTHDAAWWARRARRWCARAGSPRLILILDGLNERFEAQDWAQLCGELRLDAWEGGIALVLSDRSDHWRHQVAGFASANIPYAEHPVGNFSPEELDELLTRAGLQRAELDERLIRLLRVPRLCALALRHWEKLGQSGDITPERLIYEDFRDRVFPELADDDMRNLIASVGEQIRSSATTDITVLRRDIRAALAEESGVNSSNAAISEIASGIWFQPTDGEPNRLKVNPDLAPVAIGLALARAVQGCATAAEVNMRIEAFVDDLRGLELGITIIGIAASFMTIWPKAAHVSRDTLLDTWLGSDNFADAELKRYTRLFNEAPTFFIDRTEAVWRDRLRLHNDRNIHLAGLINAAEVYPNVRSLFVERATCWLGETFGWRDAMNGGAAPAPIAAAAVRRRVEAWNLARGDLPIQVFIEPADEEDWISVAGTVISAISYLPRAPFAAAVGAYAVAMTLTRQVHFKREAFQWLLRANLIDPEAAEIALVAQAGRIAEVDHEDAITAADVLLEALGSLDSTAQPSSPPREQGGGATSTVRVDPDGTVHWTPAIDRANPDWGDRTLRRLGELPRLAGDPATVLASEGIELLCTAFDAAVAAEKPLDLEAGARAVLARWAPERLAAHYCATDGVATAGRDRRDRLHRLQASWLVHDEHTRQGIAEAYRTVADAAAADMDKWDTDLTVLHLSDHPAAEQLAAFGAMPQGPLWPIDSDTLLAPLSLADFDIVALHLQSTGDPVSIASWLGLLAHSDLSHMPPGYAPVAALFDYADTRVRMEAYRVASRAPDPELANILRDRGWRAGKEANDEDVHGSVALAHATPAPNDDRPSRVTPIALGYLSRQWPAEARFSEAFAEWVRQRIDGELSTGSRHGYGRAFDDRESYTALVKADPDRAEQWLSPALEGKGIAFADLMFSAQKATVELARALIDQGRQSGADVLAAVKAGVAKAGLGWDAAGSMSFQAACNPVSEELRQRDLAAANVDEILWDIASGLQKRGETAGLLEAIRQLAAGNAYDMAKALVLAGELDQGADADALWTALLERALPAWLMRVRTRAAERYAANINARHWLRLFCTSNDRLAAFGAFEIFARIAGRACTLWASKLIDEARPTMTERAYQHWLMNIPQLNHHLKAGDQGAKNQLAYLVIPKRDQHPWRT